MMRASSLDQRIDRIARLQSEMKDMNIELKNRKAIVTGSTAGIGRAIAEGLARAGASVVVNGRAEERVSTALREMRALLPEADLAGAAADVATPEGCAALFAQAPDAGILRAARRRAAAGAIRLPVSSSARALTVRCPALDRAGSFSPHRL
jgi:NAD(P)-dependent dehydrogenase (short-subunit alcohol dehydrogenase family)